MDYIDHLVHQAHFGTPIQQTEAAGEILELAKTQGARPASVYALYRARGREQLPSNFTVPAMNLRGLSYLTAQAAFEAALETRTGLLIFELARSEMKYTDQNPAQLVSSVLGAAVKTGWRYPVFIQADHVQPKAESPGVMKDEELEKVEQLIRECLDAGIYNIDLDGSTLVDVSQPTEYDQQRANFQYTTRLARLILEWQPADVTTAMGFEISEVGTHLSKSSQMSAFMTGFNDTWQMLDNAERRLLEAENREGGSQADLDPLLQEPHQLLVFPGFTKVAIETGTKHGGTVNKDGTPGPMKVDFERIQTMSILARHKYGMAGAVQHGASTLDKDIFQQFPAYETAEIHLSTGFQNLIMDHMTFPANLRRQIYQWCDKNCSKERQPDWTDAQFYIKTRKKAWGAFKKDTWNLPPQVLSPLKHSLKTECRIYFESLKVADTLELLQQYTIPRES